MNTVSQDRIIGMDVSRDWLDIHFLPDGNRLRLPNTDEGHERLIQLARPAEALVCFEATGGQEWRLWAALDAAGVATRQVPPAQIKAFAASRGTSPSWIASDQPVNHTKSSSPQSQESLSQSRTHCANHGKSGTLSSHDKYSC
ncbi:hypothetical protein [Ruegeria sp. HKCCD8929]|uniref:hypothetical protein n=1 Tax=Ruegeria sp. HKCCD8929 TaxID=2683006 RepID=UPI0015831AF3|nr:hypothetical protein [Ruegeria sp. HKCCD8929]